jgi:hypothetical protein
MIVAAVALVFALAGTAIAGTDSVGKLTKSKVKSIAKAQADKELKANIPGSHVNTAETATNATNATNATKAATATVAGDARFATKGANFVQWVTNTDQVAQTVALPAGVWAITATVVANNNDAAMVHFDCHLVAGGTEVSRLGPQPYPELVVALGPQNGDDRKEVTLTGATKLASAGNADLICRSDGTTGNWVEGTITAIQVATLNGG